MNITTLGIDLAKNVFQICGMNAHGKVILTKRLSRKKLLPYLANIQACLIGIEACGGAHFWAREITKLGHTVKIMSPQFVKPTIKTNKSDYNDAEGICEAVARPTMRFVPMKTIEQQDVQCVHRIRSQLIKSQTALVNQMRGLLSEYGVVIPKGIGHVRKAVPQLLEDADNGLSDLFRTLLNDRYAHLKALDEQVKTYDQKIQALFKQDAKAQRLESVEGVGPMGATAFIAAIGDPNAFSNGRQVSAWLGIVPGQHSSGDKTVLLGISKRGDCYLRTLLIHGGRSAVTAAEKKQDPRSRWINGIVARRGKNVAAVAVANKNARHHTLLSRSNTAVYWLNRAIASFVIVALLK